MLVGLASVGGIGYAASTANHTWHVTKRAVSTNHKQALFSPASKNSPARDQYVVQKVTLCHNGHTISVAQPAVAAHLAQGDTLGPCHSAVAGASVAFRRGSGGGGGTSGGVLSTALPFTGFPVWAAVLAGLVLVSGGLGLRRTAREYQV
jgi:hypothetical protein